MDEREPDATAQAALREALAQLLAPAGGDPLSQDLADVLWISRLTGLAPLPAGGAAPHGDTPTRAEEPEPLTVDQPEPAAEPSGPAQPSAGPKAELHPRAAAEATGPVGSRGGEAVQVTRPAALPGALGLARALRPLRRPLRNPVGRVERAGLDEEATADSTADVGVLLPVWRQEQQRRFSVDLLVDTGATMAVWHGLAGEFATLLERHGAFVDVRCWSLDTDHAVPHLTPFRRRSRRPRAASQPSGPARNWARPLADPLGRRILLVLTDGVGPAWYGEELPAFLARALGGRPAAVLQVLPRRLWHRTALRPAPVEGRAATHGQSAPVLRSDAALPGIPRGPRGSAARAAVRWLPVLEIDAEWLAPWAEVVAGRASGWTPMLAAPVRGVPRPQHPGRAVEEPVTAAERVARFRAGSSPGAYRLACHVAAAPLSLPVMRLVQQATLPGTGQQELAELFLSGLLELREEALDPDEVVYDFREAVREELLAELTRSESVRVLESVLAKVSGRVAATFGGTLDFRALAATAGAGGLALPSRSRPFAEVAVAVLAGAGGQHAALARTLSAAVEAGAGAGAGVADGTSVRGAVIRHELLGPAPIISPPDPLRMIGRQHKLALLEQAALADRHSTVVIEAVPGLGKRRLVQEYIQWHGARHSFIHWIDGDTVSVVAGLAQLRSALDPADLPSASFPPLSQLLREHPGWLIVIDGLSQDSVLTSLGVRFGLADAGPGCLIVTTGLLDSSRARDDATVITLGELTDDELLHELRLRLDELSPGREQDEQLRQLLEILPRNPGLLMQWDLDAELTAIAGFSVQGGDLEASATESAVRRVRTYRLREPAVAMAAIPSPAGQLRLAVYGRSGQVHFYDLTDGSVVGEPITLRHAAEVVAMAALSDEDGRVVLYTADRDGQLSCWSSEDGSLLARHQGFPRRPVAMAGFGHADRSQSLWAVDDEGHTHLWDPIALRATRPDIPLFDGRTATTVPRVAGPSALLVAESTGLVYRCELDGSDRVVLSIIGPAAARTIVGLSDSPYECASLGDQDDLVQVWEMSVAPRRAAPHDRTGQDTGRIVADRYRLVRQIGRGGAGEVWKAVDELGGSAVVVKLFDRSRGGRDSRRLSRFLSQAETVRGLRHRGITTVRDAGVEDDTGYLVLDLIDGPDLRGVLAGGRLPLSRAVAVARRVAEALDYLHDHGVVHHDIKPANILIPAAGEAVLCDYGFDWAGPRWSGSDTTSVEISRELVTPRYMSPEQAGGAVAGPTSDLYSLGCVLYEMLTGAPPFTDRSEALLTSRHIDTAPAFPQQIEPEVPQALDVLVRELLQKDPDLRPQTAAEVARRLASPGVLRRPDRPAESESESPLRFTVLGPVRAWRGEDPVELSPRQLAVLAVLILNHGRPVTTSELVDAVWQRAPRSAAEELGTYLRQIRRALNAGSAEPDVLVSGNDGHTLRVGAGAVDVVLFEDQLHRADEDLRNDDPRAALRHVRDALAVWKGRPLEDVPGPFASAQRARLQERHLDAQEVWFEAELWLGQAAELVAELQELTFEYPLRERLRAFLMLALYRSGRSAEAVDVYIDTQRVLREEHGRRPGAELADLYGRILAQDPGLLLPGQGPRFLILGPLKAWRDEPLSLGPPQQQAVLAILLLNAGRTVTVQTLVDGIWGDRPPQAVAAVRTYVSRLRAVIDPSHRVRQPHQVLMSVADGYALMVPPASIDLSEFDSRMAEATSARAAGALDRAYELLLSALSLWQGTPLAGIPGPYAERRRAELAERRIAALEVLHTVALDLGRHEESAGELALLAADHPLRERLRALQMLALHRCRRSAEARNVYRGARQLLVEELGVEPGPVLTALYRRIDADDPDLLHGSVDDLFERLTAVEPVQPPTGGRLPLVLDKIALPDGFEFPELGVAFGIDDTDLAPVFIDFETDPLLIVLGESESGKTALLRLLIEKITQRYAPDQAGIVVGDYRRSLLGVVPTAYLMDYAASAPRLAEIAETVRGACEQRLPGPDVTPEQLRNRSWYTGKDMFVIVDDYELVATSSGNPLAPLAEYLPFARDLGLRIIIARNSNGAGRAMYEPIMQRMKELGGQGVLLSGDEQEGELLHGVRLQPLPPGRGIYVSHRHRSGTLVQTALLPPSGPLAIEAAPSPPG
ncbi:hypothetical protein ASE03_25445 [Kitasatospora sp. Root187]|nr:SAV_2336 N-terminal domain-related protein [Kitasatospora sp. Root187]KRB70006.1 hypothetical protein ASE03_25445 [Kitasatospora sp. Root187]